MLAIIKNQMLQAKQAYTHVNNLMQTHKTEGRHIQMISMWFFPDHLPVNTIELYQQVSTKPLCE